MINIKKKKEERRITIYKKQNIKWIEIRDKGSEKKRHNKNTHGTIFNFGFLWNWNVENLFMQIETLTYR